MKKAGMLLLVLMMGMVGCTEKDLKQVKIMLIKHMEKHPGGFIDKMFHPRSVLVEVMEKPGAGYWFQDRTEKAFCHAIEGQNIRKMERLLGKGLDINRQGKDGMTFLIYAYLKEKKESYRYLLEHGADPNIIAQGEIVVNKAIPFDFHDSALTLAVCDYNDSFYLSQCLKHGGDPNTAIDDLHILYGALQSGRNALAHVKLLVEAGADVDGMRKKKTDSTPFISAIDSKTEAAYYLLQQGARLDNRDFIVKKVNNAFRLKREAYVGEGLTNYDWMVKLKTELERRGFDFSQSNVERIHRKEREEGRRRDEEYQKTHPTPKPTGYVPPPLDYPPIQLK